jgi:hypothetical protein
VLESLPVIDDPWFYATAVVAVLVLGVAKGGLAGGIGLVAVPLMSLTIEPARAAAILLPILMLMDATALGPWWGKWDARSLRTTAPRPFSEHSSALPPSAFCRRIRCA